MDHPSGASDTFGIHPTERRDSLLEISKVMLRGFKRVNEGSSEMGWFCWFCNSLRLRAVWKSCCPSGCPLVWGVGDEGRQVRIPADPCKGQDAKNSYETDRLLVLSFGFECEVNERISLTSDGLGVSCFLFFLVPLCLSQSLLQASMNLEKFWT